MTTLEKIRAEIAEIAPLDYPCDKRTPERIRDMALDIIDKYAEQEPTDTWSIKDVADTLAKHGLIADQEPYEDDYQTDMDEAWKQAKREPCDDVISRQAVLDLLEDTNNGWIINEVSQLPPVRPQEQTGHWIMDRLFERRTCDNCNTEYRWSFYPHNYCPNCGARMESKQNE